MVHYDIGIFIFRKDLRIHDNIGLSEFSKKCTKIIPIFIFDPYQIDRTKQNQYYRSNHGIQFMCESLIDLHKQMKQKLQFFYGSPSAILKILIPQIRKKYKTVVVGFNLDFTEYALKRDALLQKECVRQDIDIYTCDHDHTLLPFECMLKSDKTAYMVFNAFYTNAKKIKPNTPLSPISMSQLFEFPFSTKTSMDVKDFSTLYLQNTKLAQRGGRSRALASLHNKETYTQYASHRDMLAFRTFQISASLNFGCISVREAYHYLARNEIISRQLYWRDFYNCILRYTPFASSYQRCITSDYEKIKWDPHISEWTALMKARTGFLMIDAAIRELISTGYIGNRIRLILGTFWIKYLLIHPLHPKYGSVVGFSMYLVDCNTSQNKLNHQWLLELDRYRFAPRQYRLSGRPFRIDNEMIKRYDKDCIYIRKWLPEFKNISNRDIYKWDGMMFQKHKIHVPPIFDWKDRYRRWLRATENT